MNKAQFAADVADEQLDAVTRAVMASSIAVCAAATITRRTRSAMEDYYALAGIFKSTHDLLRQHGSTRRTTTARSLIRLPMLPEQVMPDKSLTPQREAS